MIHETRSLRPRICAESPFRQVLIRWRPAILSRAGSAKKRLGWTLLLPGMLVLTGGDKVLKTLALGILPDWVINL